MAVASFAFAIVVDVDYPFIQSFFGAFHMDVADSVILALRWFAILGFGLIFIVAFLAVIYICVLWVVINVIRLTKFRNKETQTHDRK